MEAFIIADLVAAKHTREKLFCTIDVFDLSLAQDYPKYMMDILFCNAVAYCLRTWYDCRGCLISLRH